MFVCIWLAVRSQIYANLKFENSSYWIAYYCSFLFLLLVIFKNDDRLQLLIAVCCCLKATSSAHIQTNAYTLICFCVCVCVNFFFDGCSMLLYSPRSSIISIGIAIMHFICCCTTLAAAPNRIAIVLSSCLYT